jgi:membrane protease YdiL (CAAX protease family)
VTEAEILSVRNEVTAIVVSVAGFSFTMISAYIAALWLFLSQAPLALRALAFLLLSAGLAFMGVMTAGLNGLLLGTETAWRKLAKPATELTGFGNASPDYLMGFTLYEAAAVLGAIAFGAIYLALFYLTFFYRWPDASAQNSS